MNVLAVIAHRQGSGELKVEHMQIKTGNDWETLTIRTTALTTL